MKIEKLWEDDGGLVINKPAGMVVNRAETTSGLTVQDWVEAEYPAIARLKASSDDNRLFRKRSGIAHRLDKETTGCLMIAKNPVFLVSLLKQFRDRLIKKEYVALVHGHLKPAEGAVKLPLLRSRYDRERWEVHYGGKTAQTGWKVEKYLIVGEREVSLVRLFPLTGRTHQIRVHLSHLGHPVFADEKYLSKPLRKEDRDKLDHHFLHAAKIGFFTQNSVWQEVKAPLPPNANY